MLHSRGSLPDTRERHASRGLKQAYRRQRKHDHLGPGLPAPRQPASRRSWIPDREKDARRPLRRGEEDNEGVRQRRVGETTYAGYCPSEESANARRAPRPRLRARDAEPDEERQDGHDGELLQRGPVVRRRLAPRRVRPLGIEISRTKRKTDDRNDVPLRPARGARPRARRLPGVRYSRPGWMSGRRSRGGRGMGGGETGSAGGAPGERIESRESETPVTRGCVNAG
jgi:hypothetical protein